RAAVDIVGANAGPHDGLQSVIAFERISGNLDAAAADGAVELGQRGTERGPFQSGANFKLNARCGSEQIKPFLSDRVENNNFRHGGRQRKGTGTQGLASSMELPTRCKAQNYPHSAAGDEGGL